MSHSLICPINSVFWAAEFFGFVCHELMVSISPVKIRFCPVQTDFTTVVELAFLLLHSLCPFLVIHSPPPSLYVRDNTQAKISPNLITSSCHGGLTYSPDSGNPQRPLWGSGCWWPQMSSLLEPAVIFGWPVICVQAVTASQFATVEIFVWMHYSGCATQVSSPPGLELAPSCHFILCLFHSKLLLWS